LGPIEKPVRLFGQPYNTPFFKSVMGYICHPEQAFFLLFSLSFGSSRQPRLNKE
jgi:hypothetical protein